MKDKKRGDTHYHSAYELSNLGIVGSMVNNKHRTLKLEKRGESFLDCGLVYIYLFVILAEYL
jgi:hypothetical protein